MLFVSVFLLFLSHKQQALGSSPPLLPKVSPGGVTQGRQTGFGSHSQARVTQGRLLLHWGSMEPRARWGQAQPDPHFAPPKPLCVGQPPPGGLPAMQGGTQSPVDPLYLPESNSFSEPPSSLPCCLPSGPACQAPLGPNTQKHSSIPSAPNQSQVPCPAASLGPPWQFHWLSLSLSLTRTQHHVSKQLTQSRELGGRKQGAGRKVCPECPALAPRREALPTPAARGLQAPQQGV